LVSGLLERDDTGASQPGKPLVGLARYFREEAAAQDEKLRPVRDFVLSEEGRVVWSPSDGGSGSVAGAASHGAFDDDEQIRNSLVAMLS
jgi:hypothetical protein